MRSRHFPERRAVKQNLNTQIKLYKTNNQMKKFKPYSPFMNAFAALLAAGSLFSVSTSAAANATLKPENPTIQVGQPFQMMLTLEGPQAPSGPQPTWTSSDPSVATVTPVGTLGRVEAKSPGTTTISVAGPKGAFKVSTKVTVTWPKIRGLGLRNAAPKPIRVGMNVPIGLRIQAFGEPLFDSPLARAGTWKSSDEKILLLNPKMPGVIFAKAPGTASITFSEISAGAASITLNVEPVDVRLTPQNATIEAGEPIEFSLLVNGRPESVDAAKFWARYGNPRSFWTSSDSGALALDPHYTGTLKGKGVKAGIVTVTFAPPLTEFKASTQVTVVWPKVIGLSVAANILSKTIPGATVPFAIKTARQDYRTDDVMVSPFVREGTWTSSDETILAPIPGASGVFFAKRVGTAAVTFSHRNAGTASFNVLVREPKVVTRLRPATARVKWGDTLDFPQVVQNGVAVPSSYWKVSPVEILEIRRRNGPQGPNSGAPYFLAKAPGTATVTHWKYIGLEKSEASATITVEPPDAKLLLTTLNTQPEAIPIGRVVEFRLKHGNTSKQPREVAPHLLISDPKVIVREPSGLLRARRYGTAVVSYPLHHSAGLTFNVTSSITVIGPKITGMRSPNGNLMAGTGTSLSLVIDWPSQLSDPNDRRVIEDILKNEGNWTVTDANIGGVTAKSFPGTTFYPKKPGTTTVTFSHPMAGTATTTVTVVSK